MVTREVIVVGWPFAPVVGISVVITSVIGAVTVLDTVVVAVTTSVLLSASCAIEEALEGVSESPAFCIAELCAAEEEEEGASVVVCVEEALVAG